MAAIYLMTIGANLTKIGFADDPERRLSQIQSRTGKPVELYAAFDCGTEHRAVEKAVHRSLKDRCVYSEVFSIAPADALPFIAAALGVTVPELEQRRFIPSLVRDGLISGVQARMARRVLGWSLPAVRERTGFSVNTVLRFEQGKDCHVGTVTKLRDLYAGEGVIFFEDGLTVTAPD